jgi:hypothetical protein
MMSENRTDAVQDVSRSLTFAVPNPSDSVHGMKLSIGGVKLDAKAPLADGSEVGGRHNHGWAEAGG